MITLSPILTQQQRVTPQQVQYLKMLQLPTAVLEQAIKQELEANPLLEESGIFDQELDFAPDQDLAPSERSGSDDDSDDDFDFEGDARSSDNELDYNAPDDYDGYKAPTFAGQEGDDYEEQPQRDYETFAQQLLAQLRMQTISDNELVLAEEIIGNIDDDGYLRRDLHEVVDDLNKFIAMTSQTVYVQETAIGDGRFDSYQAPATDQPFGRERIAAQIRQARLQEQAEHDDDTDDQLPTHHDSVAEEEGEDDEQEAPAVRGVDSISLEEMSRMSIEELAKILEMGTAAQPLGAQRAPIASQPAAKQEELAAGGMLLEPLPNVPAFTYEEAEGVLHRIQRLDPLGVGARDLRECLMVQLEPQLHSSPTAPLAYAILRDTFNDFTHKHFERICARHGCTEEELKRALEAIRSLNPKPGEGSFTITETNYITPDFLVERDGEDIIITPNDRNIPSLRINRSYQEMMRRGKKRSSAERTAQKFLREKMEAAKWFIASIHQRRQTMMRVMRAIVDLQESFFLYGPDQLKPMIYRDVAERIGMDISTVCRVVNGKYVQTDYGTFELKYFFSEKLHTATGEEVANKIVKAKIKEMIDEENKKTPLSDDEISQRMHEAGYNIARRTVAKYREQLNIPVARLRRML
ncbi:MAG: RNA polymerase factor sigma-54 [Chlorobi bacterium]|nr:MAG: DNA-directed RNA polymerase specialized sigma subunit [Chlorobi bacterium OLB7]MBK8912007.1 RNA polymerase factor sigma-54 [Chlorobiota bacterium]MBX7215355.1 RNA polymerase factor sigma-54 [Candidatus Kapabacteria bacterium]